MIFIIIDKDSFLVYFKMVMVKKEKVYNLIKIRKIIIFLGQFVIQWEFCFRIRYVNILEYILEERLCIVIFLIYSDVVIF